MKDRRDKWYNSMQSGSGLSSLISQDCTRNPVKQLVAPFWTLVVSTGKATEKSFSFPFCERIRLEEKISSEPWCSPQLVDINQFCFLHLKCIHIKSILKCITLKVLTCFSMQSWIVMIISCYGRGKKLVLFLFSLRETSSSRQGRIHFQVNSRLQCLISPK